MQVGCAHCTRILVADLPRDPRGCELQIYSDCFSFFAVDNSERMENYPDTDDRLFKNGRLLFANSRYTSAALNARFKTHPEVRSGDQPYVFKVKNHDSSIANEDSSIANDDSSIDNDDSSIDNEDSAIDNEDPSIANDDPSIENHDSSTEDMIFH